MIWAGRTGLGPSVEGMADSADAAQDLGPPIRVALLGSTGSIGTSVLNVIRRHPDRFRVTVMAAHRSVEELARQAHEFRPELVIVSDDRAFSACSNTGSSGWVGGRTALLDAVARSDVDVVVNALVGFAGLEPSLQALAAGKRLALANKESLVAGADLVLDSLHRGKGDLVPIDSEHSAILQCLEGNSGATVSRLVLTASGGPFREWDRVRLAGVRPADALDHPTWNMGAKITVDSATLANKALEVIEAHVLYQCPYDRIEVVIHPQSIIHSFVEFVDGSVVAQMGFPTMELPILYALTHPGRVSDPELRTFDPVRSPPLTFEAPDHERFPLLGIGVRAGRTGGTAPAVFNAANEIAVSAFLAEEISFLEMSDVVEETLDRAETRRVATLADVLDADHEARRIAHEQLKRRGGVDEGKVE